MRLTLAALIGLVLPVAGCTSAPDNPTWRADVKPIIEANCIKCHGRVPRGGAPNTFRLDRYNNDGLIRGSQLMAQFVAERVHTETMPPVAALSSVHIDTLRNWANTNAEEGEPDPSNQPAEIQIENFQGDDLLTLRYVISDPDFDVVDGTLEATPVGGGDSILIDRLHSGSGTATWFAKAEVEGDYDINATLDDGHSGREIGLGRFRVVHSDGDTAPKLSVIFPPSDGFVLSDNILPIDVRFSFTDPDGDLGDVTVALERGDERFELGTKTGVNGDDAIEVADTSMIPAGPGWTLVVEAGPSRATVGDIAVGHGTTALRFADVAPTLIEYCDGCHGTGNDLVNFPFVYNFGQGYANIAGFVGASYRRVAVQRSMPPASAETLLGVSPMPELERARLAEWLLAGAPE